MSVATGYAPYRFAVGFAFAALGSFLVLLAISFTAGLDLTDESLYVYLLAYPQTAMAHMDHFVWGQLLSFFSWNIIQLRWLSLAATTLSVSCLMAAVIHCLGSTTFTKPDARLSYCVAVTFSLFGAVLYFTNIRSTFSYITTLVTMSNFFVAAMLWEQKARNLTARLGALSAMAICGAIGFLARPLTPAVLLIVVFFFNQIEGRSLRTTFKLVGILLLAWVGLIGAALLIGYDWTGQATLLTSLAKGSHSFTKLVKDAISIGAKIFAEAALLAAVFAVVLRWIEARNRYAYGHLFLAGLTLAVALIFGRNVFRSYLGVMASSVAPHNLGVFFHVFTMALLLDRFGPNVAVGWRTLQHISPSRPAKRNDRHMAALAVALYGACLAGFVGTNTGMWSRSLMNMGPLLLLCALLLIQRLGENKISQWTFALLGVPIYLLVFQQLYLNQYAHPFRVHGSVAMQTAQLDHPAVLSGLWVSPDILQLQQNLERDLQIAGFDPERDRIFPGDHRDGTVLLASGRSLSTPWTMTGYPESDSWNCAVFNLGLRYPVRRVIGIDLWTFDNVTIDCLRKFGSVANVARKNTIGAITVIVHDEKHKN